MPLPGSLAQKVHRQAAAAIGRVLAADASKQNGASIKRLALAQSNLAKRATFALICETLKHLSVIKDVLSSTDILKRNKKIKPELAYVLLYDLLFGEGLFPHGDAERAILSCKSTLKAAFARLMVKRQVADVRDLLPETAKQSAPSVLRHVRVNTLKMSIQDALNRLRSHSSTSEVRQDELLPEVLVLPAGTDLHDHPMVKNGFLVLQGKASCLPARALQPDPSWTVLDACAAPGNKTTHLAALMEGKGCVMACDADARRLKRLKEAVAITGAKNIRVMHQDFLKIDYTDPSFKKIHAILLDPSCSGSGTKMQRLDHLLPSAAASRDNPEEEKRNRNGGEVESEGEAQRVGRLALFQERALTHALQFPNVQRVVYSTCSVHSRENEEVVKAVLPMAKQKGFQLSSPFPGWSRRGLPLLEGAHHLLRTDPAHDEMEGFFVALFERGDKKACSNERLSKKREAVSGNSGQILNTTAKKTKRAPVDDVEEDGEISDDDNAVPNATAKKTKRGPPNDEEGDVEVSEDDDAAKDDHGEEKTGKLERQSDNAAIIPVQTKCGKARRRMRKRQRKKEKLCAGGGAPSEMDIR